MKIYQLQEMLRKLEEQKENQLVNMGVTIGKIELVRELINEAQDAGGDENPPAALSFSDLEILTGLKVNDEPQPVQ